MVSKPAFLQEKAFKEANDFYCFHKNGELDTFGMKNSPDICKGLVFTSNPFCTWVKIITEGKWL